MTNKSIRPEDVLSEHENYVEINGIKIRKATMAATLKNAGVLSSAASSAAEKAAAKEMIKELSPGLLAMGLLDHLTWKNPEIQEVFENGFK